MRRNICILYAIALLQGMVFYGPVATLYRQARGVSVLEITVIESASLALAVALEVPWGVLADRIGYRRTMISCCGIYFVSKIVFWQAAGFAGFLAERVLLSVVTAGLSGVDTSLLYLSCQGRDSQRVFGIYNSLGMAGLLMAAGVFAAAIRDDYALAGLLTVGSYGLAAALSLGLREVRAPAETARREPFASTLGAVLRDRGLLLFLVGAALLSEVHQTITVFLNQLQYARCGMGSAAIGVAYIAATLLGLLGVYSAAVTRGLGTRGSVRLFCGMAFGACLVLALTGRALPSVLGILTLRLCDTLFQPFRLAIQNRHIHTENRATALSVHAMLMSAVAIGTNLLFGALSDWSLSAAFLFGALISALSLACFHAWRRETATSQP